MRSSSFLVLVLVLLATPVLSISRTAMQHRTGLLRAVGRRRRCSAFLTRSRASAGNSCPLSPRPTIPRCISTRSTTSSRLFSTAEKTSRKSITREEDDRLLDPHDILRDLQNQTNVEEVPKIPLPTHLSPTSMEQFSKCPQAFFFLYILKLAPDPPMTPQLARGIVCHTALEEVFELRPEDRSLDNLQNLFRREWGRLRGDRRDGADGDGDASDGREGSASEYDVLFREESDDGATLGSYDTAEEIEWGKSSLDLLRNYFLDLEDPRTVSSPNPLTREMWVQARFPCTESAEDENDGPPGSDDGFIVRGKIDRIDVLPGRSDDKVHLRIIDYKTGKKPWFKYSQSVNDRIRREQFWKMKVYALVLWKMILQSDETSSMRFEDREGKYKYGIPWDLQQRLLQAMEYAQNNPRWSDILELDSLRLMYLTSHADDLSANDSTTLADDRSIGRAKNLDYAIGYQKLQSILDETEHEVRTIARDIKTLVDMQSPHAFEHCDWRYCSCHELRKRFRPGSVYQSPDLYH